MSFRSFSTSLVAQSVKNLPAMQYSRLPEIGKIPWGRKWQPTQCSCLESPMDRGARWAAVHEVTRVAYNLATKPPPPITLVLLQEMFMWLLNSH